MLPSEAFTQGLQLAAATSAAVAAGLAILVVFLLEICAPAQSQPIPATSR